MTSDKGNVLCDGETAHEDDDNLVHQCQGHHGTVPVHCHGCQI